jgi:hypothetical protein
MKLPVDGFQALLIDVSVNLRGRNVGVAEHFLNDPEIGPIAEQMGGEAVPEQMRINIFLQAGVSRFFLHDLPNPRRR